MCTTRVCAAACSQRFHRSSLPSVWQALGGQSADGEKFPEMELEWVLDGYAWPHVMPLLPPGHPGGPSSGFGAAAGSKKDGGDADR